jgi:hypothetical protein
MGLPTITINRGQGGLGRPLTSKDHVSGFVMPFVNASLPVGFSTTDRIKIVYSISELEALGVTKAGADTKVLWYHVNQFFAKQPKGKLFVMLADSTAITSADIKTLQYFADGEIRQMAFYNPLTAFSTSICNSLQTHATTLESENMPLSVIFAGNFQGVSTLGSLSDLKALSNKNVSVVVGEDGAGEGKALADAMSYSITCIGATLGTIANAEVFRNIGHVGRFNQVDGTEFDVPALAINTTTTLVKDQSSSALNDLHDKGYIFLKKYTGYTGTFYNDAPTAIANTSDYSTIENNRTMDKAVRGIRNYLLPFQNAPLYVNEDGTLTEDVIALYKNETERALEQMERDGEISKFSVTINPAQNVLTTSKISIAIKVVPVGVAREIEVNIGFAVSL